MVKWETNRGPASVSQHRRMASTLSAQLSALEMHSHLSQSLLTESHPKLPTQPPAAILSPLPLPQRPPGGSLCTVVWFLCVTFTSSLCICRDSWVLERPEGKYPVFRPREAHRYRKCCGRTNAETQTKPPNLNQHCTSWNRSWEKERQLPHRELHLSLYCWKV